MRLNSLIDHTLLKPAATIADIRKLCEEADKYHFFSVCVNSSFVPLAASCLKKSSVKVCSVVGFPLGAMSTAAKVFEAKQAIADGADEIDMVINVGMLLSGEYDYAQKEIKAIQEVVKNRVLKVILETGFLWESEITKASELAVLAGADFVKTSTGFGPRGASIEDVILMKDAVAGKAQIKASGGIRDLNTAQKYIDLGVTRLGTSSGVALMKGLKVDDSNNY